MDWALFQQVIEIFAHIFGFVGAALIVYGGLRAMIQILQRELFHATNTYNEIRREFTHKIVFGLEFFIAGDVLTTLIAPTQQELIILGAVVLIRTILGFFLSKDIKESSLDA